jgi:hypothetical protein
MCKWVGRSPPANSGGIRRNESPLLFAQGAGSNNSPMQIVVDYVPHTGSFDSVFLWFLPRLFCLEMRMLSLPAFVALALLLIGIGNFR